MFNQLITEHLESLGFKWSLADKNIFMRLSNCKTIYKYMITYVDDLCIIATKPKELLDKLHENLTSLT